MSIVNASRKGFARALAHRDVHFGWAMAALAFLYSLFSSAAMGVPGVLIVPMSK